MYVIMYLYYKDEKCNIDTFFYFVIKKINYHIFIHSFFTMRTIRKSENKIKKKLVNV